MSRGENEAVARRLLQAHNRDDLALLAALFAPDYVNRTARPGQAGAAGRWQIATYRAAFPDLRATLEELVGARDRVRLRWTTTSTNTGAPIGTPLGTIAQGHPTGGRPARVVEVDVVRVADGRIAEERTCRDRLGWRQQPGAFPARPSPG